MTNEVEVSIKLSELENLISLADSIVSPCVIFDKDNHQMALSVIDNNITSAALIVSKLIKIRG